MFRRKASAGNAYLAHFFCLSGAWRLLAAAAADYLIIRKRDFDIVTLVHSPTRVSNFVESDPLKNNSRAIE